MSSQGMSSDANVLLLDIEGTTTSIDFVKGELFPYVLKNVKSYLEANWEEEETISDVKALREQAEADKSGDFASEVEQIASPETNREDIIESVVTNVKWQMGLDRKTTALKQLQGHMWLDAYKRKEVKGHLYEEVADCMRKWRKQGKKICIYSSGSVAAQKLLFTYSIEGDLTENISAYFDTKIGGKREVDSYKNIVKELGEKPGDVLFLTDIIEEAEAARQAGLYTAVMLRPGNAPLTEKQLEGFKTLNNFTELELEASVNHTKRSKPDS